MEKGQQMVNDMLNAFGVFFYSSLGFFCLFFICKAYHQLPTSVLSSLLELMWKEFGAIITLMGFDFSREAPAKKNK